MNQIIHGDCLEELIKIEDNSVQLVIADLPYQVTNCNWDILVPLDKLWPQLLRVGKENCAFIFTATNPFAAHLIMSQPKLFKYEYIWRKNQGTNPMCAKIQPLRNHEQVLVFYRKQPGYNPQMWFSTPYSGFSTQNNKKTGEIYGAASVHRDNPEGSRYPLTVQEFKMEKGLHPTQKPLSMMEFLVKTYSNEEDVVLDPTCGSGTVCLAAKNLNRKYIGIEKNESYYNVAMERLK